MARSRRPRPSRSLPAASGKRQYTLELLPTDIAIDAIALHLPETARLELSPQSLRVNHLAVLWGSSRLTAAGSLTDTEPGTLDAALDADVSDVLALGRAAGVSGALVDTGRIRATVVAAGTLATPVVSGDVVVQDAAGTLAGRRVSGANARLALRNGWIELSQLSAVADGLALSARGGAPAAWISEVAPALPRSWFPPAAGATATLAGELSGSPSPLLRSFLPPDMVGESELGVTFVLEAAGPRLSAVWADVTVAHAALAVGASRLVQAAPARMVIEGHRASLDAWRLTGEGTDLRVTGDVTFDAEAPTSFHVEAAGALNIAPARAFTGAPVRGTLDVQLSADGTFDAPRLHGTLDLREGIFSVPKLHVAATDVVGHARFEGEQMTIERLAGNVNGSPVSASGDVAVFGAADRAHALRVSTTRLPLQLIGGARAEIDADLALTAGAGARRLSGRVEITPEPFRGSVAVIKQLIALQRAARTAAQQPASPAGPPLQLDVVLVTRDNLIVDSSFGRVELAADLRLVGTLEQPLLKGQATVLPDGVLRAGVRRTASSEARSTSPIPGGSSPRSTSSRRPRLATTAFA